MSGARKQDQPNKRKEQNGDGRDPLRRQPSPEGKEAENIVQNFAANQFISKPRYIFPERNPEVALVVGSAPARLENCIYKQDMIRGKDGLMYPIVPWRSLREKMFQDDKKERLEAQQRQPTPPRTSSSSSPSPSRESSSDDELQFQMDMD